MSTTKDDLSLLAKEIGQPLTPQINLSDYSVVLRHGEVVPFNLSKITVAITKSYIAVHSRQSAMSSSARDHIATLSALVAGIIQKRRPEGGPIYIEDIQDIVELALMRNGEFEVAKSYVLYREERAKERLSALKALEDDAPNQNSIMVVYNDGVKRQLNQEQLKHKISLACHNLDNVDAGLIINDVLRSVYNGINQADLDKAVILSARALIESEPNYNYVTARLLLEIIRSEVFVNIDLSKDIKLQYSEYFPAYIQKGIANGLLTPDLASFDLAKLSSSLVPERDLQFKYLGLQTLYDRYFLHIDGVRIEMPQIFFMRVAMGLALKETDKTSYAIKFYNLLSSFDFMSSTPTLFNSGTLHSQLSSCYLTTISDDLSGIYDAIKENALLSKYAGGLGNDWSNVRAMGSVIKGTNGKSQGVIPFLKVVNDTAVAVNQGGKRKGAVCTYLETWHLDIEEFLELRKNTGDDRRRCHDMNTANWIPDLFMKRVHEKSTWMLFSPNDVPNLHDKYGIEFEQQYLAYEAMARNGQISLFKEVEAVELWRKMLTMLYSTGHPWITFKDPCNLRSPQQHVGVVHSSNLCTEITLNTNEEEIAVCNLGSVNLVNHMHQGALDQDKLKTTISLAMRMLDNVVDINFYPVEKAKTSNLRHRPVGLGIMGFQDTLHMLKLPYASKMAVEFADQSMELIAYLAYNASSDLAVEKGQYQSYAGSLWSQGILPLDSIDLVRQARGDKFLDVDTTSRLDWDGLKAKIAKQGMRNSNCLAIAPTATIANIVGVSASIEPTYQNLFVKSNLSGEFTVVNEFLVANLRELGLWDEVMLADIKYFDGSLAKIERIPQEIKHMYLTAFEMDATWLVECASRRQKWIDQAQSLNLYLYQPTGKKLDELYKFAWIKGLKTTYYLRTLAASSAEKSTGSGGELNSVALQDTPSVAKYGLNTSSASTQEAVVATDAKFCSIDDPDCESCQ